MYTYKKIVRFLGIIYEGYIGNHSWIESCFQVPHLQITIEIHFTLMNQEIIKYNQLFQFTGQAFYMFTIKHMRYNIDRKNHLEFRRKKQQIYCFCIMKGYSWSNTILNSLIRSNDQNTYIQVFRPLQVSYKLHTSRLQSYNFYSTRTLSVKSSNYESHANFSWHCCYAILGNQINTVDSTGAGTLHCICILVFQSGKQHLQILGQVLFAILVEILVEIEGIRKEFAFLFSRFN